MILTEKSDAVFAMIYDIHNPSFQFFERASKGMLREQFDKGTVFVSYLSGGRRLAGYAIVTEKNAQPYVWEIAVASLYRGQGYGAALLGEIEVWARENEKREITLNCLTENPAQKLYFDAGYRVTKVLLGYYGAGRNGIVMRRNLC